MNGAHVHLALNHIPVLGGILTLILLILVWRQRNQYLLRWTCLWMVLMGLLAIPVYLSGEPAEEIVEHLAGETIEPFIEAHEQFAFYSLTVTEVLAVLALAILYQSRKKEGFEKSRFLKFLIVVAALNCVLMMITSNLGGQIRHTEIRAGFQLSNPVPDAAKD